jgi:hypothetical protein
VHSEALPAPGLLEMQSLDDENENYVTFIGKVQRYLLTKNQYGVEPLIELSCSLAESHLISQADVSSFVHDLNL